MKTVMLAFITGFMFTGCLHNGYRAGVTPITAVYIGELKGAPSKSEMDTIKITMAKQLSAYCDVSVVTDATKADIVVDVDLEWTYRTPHTVSTGSGSVVGYGYGATAFTSGEQEFIPGHYYLSAVVFKVRKNGESLDEMVFPLSYRHRNMRAKQVSVKATNFLIRRLQPHGLWRKK